MAEGHSEIPYVILGVILGLGGAYAYKLYLDSKVQAKNTDITVKLLSNDKIPAGAESKVAILKMDDKGKAIDYVSMNKGIDGAYRASLPLNTLPSGAYLLTVAFYSDNKYVGDIETEITIPNDIGLTVPEHEIRMAGTLGVNLRG